LDVLGSLGQRYPSLDAATAIANGLTGLAEGLDMGCARR
jgi:hypothetical protein